MKNTNKKSNAGLSLVDVVIGIGLVSLAFLGIFGLLRLGFKVVGKNKAQLTGVAMANQQIESIRSLPYDSVGIQGGFPSGILPPSTTTVQNNITYTIENRVDYVIDSADGVASPEDSCPNDYKKVEVTVSWGGKYAGQEVLTTNVAPANLAQECAETGGILLVSVFDAYGEMVASPLIEIRDPDTDELIKSATPDDGEHYFSLNSSTSYKVMVSKSGFSSERTYGINEVANPEKPHLWVFEDQLTESSFSIDETSIFAVETSSPWSEGYFSDPFIDTSKLVDTTDVSVDGGRASLENLPGVYFEDGGDDSDLCSFPGDSGDCAQSFTTGGRSESVSQIKLFIKKGTSSPSDIYLEVRTASTTGPLLASSTLIDGSSLPINLEWVTFSLHNPVNLNSNTQYFLRLRSVPDSVTSQGAGPVLWGYQYSTSSPPGYAGGNAFRYVGKNQEVLSDYDFSFNIYEDEYKSSGSLTSVAISPSELTNWQTFSWSDSESVNTDLRYQFFYASGTNWLLIPDGDLSNNSSGFDISPVDLSGLSTTSYPQLRIKATFSSSDTGSSPFLEDWQVSWITSSATPIPNVSFLLHGAKIIGTDQEESPVYKYSATTTSNDNGQINIPDLEWDSYTFSLPADSDLNLMGTDPSPQPISLAPDGVTQPVSLYLEANNSLLVTIEDNQTFEPVFAADVRLYSSGLGYDQTQPTNEDGQTFFMPLETGNYDLEVSASGHQATSTEVSIGGDETQILRLEQID